MEEFFRVNLEQIFNSHGENTVCSENIDTFIVLAASQVSWARNEKRLWQCYQPKIFVLSPGSLCRGKAVFGSSGCS